MVSSFNDVCPYSESEVIEPEFINKSSMTDNLVLQLLLGVSHIITGRCRVARGTRLDVESH